MSQAQLLDVVNQAREGNPKAFTRLYSIYFNRVYYTACKILRNESAAEEVAQESFLRLLTKFDTLREPERFESWLFTIVYRQSQYWIRENRTPVPIDSLDTLREDDEENPTVIDTEFLPAEALEEKEDRELLLRLVDDLPEAQRTALVLYYYDGLSAAEIAEVLQVSASTINKRLYDARASLKATFSRAARSAGCEVRSSDDALVLARLLQGEMSERQTNQARQRTSVQIAAVLPTLLSTPAASEAMAGRAQAFLKTGRAAKLLGAKLGPQVATKVICGLAAAALATGAGYALYRQNAAHTPAHASGPKAGASAAAQSASTPAAAAAESTAQTSERKTAHDASYASEAATGSTTPAGFSAPAPASARHRSTITITQPTLTYAAGTPITAARIMADCEAAAYGIDGGVLSVSISGLDRIDFAQPGIYHAYLHATDPAGNQAQTAILRIQIE